MPSILRPSRQQSYQSSSSKTAETTEPLDESDDDVEDLLYGAQMDFISHNNVQAVAKLQRAVRLGSSAACATLGSLLSRGLHAALKSPDAALSTSHGRKSFMQSPPQSGPARTSDSIVADGLAAAQLFVLGLSIEVEKPIDPLLKTDLATGEMEKERVGCVNGDGGSCARESSESEMEDDGGEGRYFNVERALELVVALCDSYRFGVLRPGNDAAVTSVTGGDSTTCGSLWKQGAQVAHSALLHPCLRSQPRTKIDPTPQRSFSSSSHSSTTAAAQHAKLRPSIQAHLYYLLALQAWPSDQTLAERYWTEITHIAATSSDGTIGTKRGDEILEKTLRRLRALSDEPDCAWKLAKRHKIPRTVGSGSVSEASHSTDGTLVEELPSSATSRASVLLRNGSKSGDALVDMWHERRAVKGDGEPAPATPDVWSGADKQLGSPNGAGSSPVHVEPERSNFTTFRAQVGGIPALGYPSPPISPPDTPEGSPVISNNEDEETSPVSEITLPQIRCRPSNSSFHAPPRLPGVYRRAPSIASVTTLPGNFFSSMPAAVSAVTYPALSSPLHTSSNPNLAASHNPNPEAAVGWTQGFRQRLLHFRATSSRLNPFRPEKPSAVDVLKKVLKQDDNSAGPGMMWADFEEREALESDEESATEVQEPQEPAPSRSQRSRPKPARRFVDPTTHAASPLSMAAAITPTITQTPPTPDRLSTLLHPNMDDGSAPPPPAPRWKKPSTLRKNSNNLDEMDPVLRELERKSRVGVKSTCATCSTKGLNYPVCPRCKLTFCTRACRIAVNGGGDGIRHVCKL